VLTQAPVGRRGDLLSTIVGAYRSEWAAYRQQREAREAAVEETQRAHRQQVTEQEQNKAQMRNLGVYGLSGGLGVLVLVSLFLTHFAIERHLRLMRGLVADGQGAS
jgi:hypothetical protein